MRLEQFHNQKNLSELSTFGIGGPARWFFEAHRSEELQAAVALARHHAIPYFILGKGSNTLFDDRGFNGLVLLNKIVHCEESEGRVRVGAGYPFSLLGVQTARSGWSGLEFASGIPGTVGGAIFMNAGANGRETSQLLDYVTVMDKEGSLHLYSRRDLQFSYRFSSLQEIEGCVIIEAIFALHPFQPDLLYKHPREKQLALLAYRKKTQPWGEHSAGCAFRNPSGEASAGALIDRCGCKGLRIGGAEVSRQHANFFVNRGNATAQDVLTLINVVREIVFVQTGVLLEMEIRYQQYL
jgi:UDP-N-acetylmuramate dehydrogenase